ncbi:MAG TPA: S41 family peptidase [Williamwhitmania sp.]|nr:S41 family peptidase [Williamwhitmania sp.]
MKMLFRIGVVTALAASLFITSCTKESSVSEVDYANTQLYQIMQSYYLWYDHVPKVNPSDFSNPSVLMDSLRYKALDRYSFVMSYNEYVSYFQQGVYVGYGISLAFDDQNNLRLAYIFDDSPLKAAGATRGWIINSINGTTPTSGNLSSLLGPATEGYSATFAMTDLNGVSHQGDFAKKQVAMNTVLAKKILNIGGERVGYLSFYSFIDNSVAELDSAFKYFEENSITKLVVDLRYNGGGLTNVATQLASEIIGNGNSSNVFYRFVNNNLHSNLDSTVYFENRSYAASGLTSVAFITTANTASSSELVINGLKPYMNVKLVGSTTYGKPVGMYIFFDKNYSYAFFPICFSTQNSLGVGDYYSGIPVDIAAADDLAKDFGDPTEDSMAKALQALGVSTTRGNSVTAPSVQRVLPNGAFGVILGSY